jgi:hypothetical protein
MFERLQRPFLTVETGEAYQPIRITLDILNQPLLINNLSNINCLQKTPTADSWNWYWQAECEHLRFESLDTFKKNQDHPLRLGLLSLRNNKLYISLPSFKRACLAIPFFYKALGPNVISFSHADFINKVFGIDERLPHGFTELFKEDELDSILKQRLDEYYKVQAQIEEAQSAEEALNILTAYTKNEATKRLPFAERYQFQGKVDNQEADPEVIFLGFYIFLRSRELVAIRRWFGETGYTLADAAEETVEQVFGGMDIDILDD